MSVDQSRFTAAMLDPAQPVPEGLTDPLGRPAGKRFDVYRNNVAVSLTEAMQVAFPVVLKLVGDEFFKAMAGVFLRLHQPRTPLMMHYGQAFPEFLERFEPVQDLRYLPDVARLELALRTVYHAADAVPVSPETLQRLPSGRLMSTRLILAPALALVRSAWPVHAIWRANMVDDAPQPEMRAEDVLITRPEFDPVQTLLPPGGALFIAGLQAGDTLGAALGKATAQAPNFDLTQPLGALISGRAIVDVAEGES